MAQSKFNPETLNQDWKSVKEDSTWNAKIMEITELKACEVYGQDCKNPDSDVIYLKVQVTGGIFFYETYSLPKTPGAWKRDTFKLGNFARKYGSVPYEGQEVQVKLNAEGYYRIAI